MRTVLHVGPHKTGSTWLQRDVFPLIRGGATVVSDESLAGDLFDPPEPVDVCVDRLADQHPEAEVLIVWRDPEGWRRSVYSQYVHQGGYLDRDRFWAEVPVARTGSDPGALVAAFRRRFPVHVIHFAELSSDPVRTAHTVAGIIGGTLEREPSPSPRNRSLARPTLLALRWWNRLFRRSSFNPSPPVPLSWAPRMRFWMQNRVDPLVPERWR